ncbi:MAG: aminotransferase class V-fold PLP-dependent enzyme [Dethiosulfatibacter sp.]|nr:aminotransferase class V-fold PLP-dependent enzyme [Dethiosulfatibacter sp.]
MKQIYMDNGATSFPKAPGVAERVYDYLIKVGTNLNRSNYGSSYVAESVTYETRELVCSLFKYDKPENVVFTKNVTESLNVLIKGIFKSGDHVLISSMEHNAVMRPLNGMEKKGISYTKIISDREGVLDVKDIEKFIRPNTKGLIMTHASNVCGTTIDIEKVGKICKQNGLLFIVDTAQTAGLLDIDYYKMNMDALAFTGHKSLLGPQGIGGFVINDRLAEQMGTLIEGGTGSLSDIEVQPGFMPDKFESGTLNIPGIFGLNEALKYIIRETPEAIRVKEMTLTGIFIEALLNMKYVELIGRKSILNRTGIVSIDFKKDDNGIMAQRLFESFGITTRSGLHCSPSAHQTLGTFPRGTVRFGISHFMSDDDIRYAIDSVYQLQKIMG